MELPRILISGKFVPNDLVVSLSESNRKINSEIEAKLEDIWEAKKKKAVKIFKSPVSEEISKKIDDITKVIIKECTLELNGKSPHLEFLNKLTSRKFKYPRVKVFTLNYDLLFEKAASLGNYIVINGFSFSSPAYFNGAFFDYDIVDRKNSRINPEENFVPKVFHLYKPHGSINWGRGEDNKIVIEEGCKNPIMIYPNADKYEYGYDQPFFEMMSHFQQSVRKANSLLICIGFGFGDKHFRNVIIEAVKSNPGLMLIIALPNFSESDAVEDLRELSEKQNNIFFIKEYFEDFVESYPFSTDYESEK